MSFLTVGGDGSQKPTFFELIAADRLMPSLKAAIVFSLSVQPFYSSSAAHLHIQRKNCPLHAGACHVMQLNAAPLCMTCRVAWQVFAQRRPVLHWLLDWEDELFALVTAFLDRQSLASSSSTFADSLYGLRRAPHARDGPPKSLTERQQKVTLLLLVRRCLRLTLCPALAFKSAHVCRTHFMACGALNCWLRQCDGANINYIAGITRMRSASAGSGAICQIKTGGPVQAASCAL